MLSGGRIAKRVWESHPAGSMNTPSVVTTCLSFGDIGEPFLSFFFPAPLSNSCLILAATGRHKLSIRLYDLRWIVLAVFSPYVEQKIALLFSLPFGYV